MIIGILDQLVGDHLNATSFENSLRISAKSIRERPEQSIRAFDQDDTDLIARDVVVVLAGNDVHQLGERPCGFDTGWATTDDDEGQERVAGCRIARGVGALEAGQHVVAEPRGIGQRLQADRDIGDGLIAEVVVDTAACQDDIVIGKLVATGQAYDLTFEVHALDPGLPEAHVRRAAEDGSKRIGDIAWVQQPSGDLVQQRREQMVIVLVEEGHVDRSAIELASAGQAAEPGPHDDDLRLRHRSAREDAHALPEARLRPPRAFPHGRT